MSTATAGAAFSREAQASSSRDVGAANSRDRIRALTTAVLLLVTAVMVVIARPSWTAASARQLLARRPSICTVQAPHWP